MSSEQASSEQMSSEQMSSEQDRWRATVPALQDDAIDHVVVVQCELSWLLDWSDLRDELDEALLRRLLLDRDFRVTRLIWHDIPAELVASAGAPADAVFGEHRGWIERLTASLSLVNSRDSARLRVLRLIERAGDVGHPPDGIAARASGEWISLAKTDGADLERLVSAVKNVTLLTTGIGGDVVLPAEDLDVTHLL